MHLHSSAFNNYESDLAALPMLKPAVVEFGFLLNYPKLVSRKTNMTIIIAAIKSLIAYSMIN